MDSKDELRQIIGELTTMKTEVVNISCIDRFIQLFHRYEAVLKSGTYKGFEQTLIQMQSEISLLQENISIGLKEFTYKRLFRYLMTETTLLYKHLVNGQ